MKYCFIWKQLFLALNQYSRVLCFPTWYFCYLDLLFTLQVPYLVVVSIVDNFSLIIFWLDIWIFRYFHIQMKYSGLWIYFYLGALYIHMLSWWSLTSLVFSLKYFPTIARMAAECWLNSFSFCLLGKGFHFSLISKASFAFAVWEWHFSHFRNFCV